MSAAALFTAGSGSYFTPHSERLDVLTANQRVAASEAWNAVLRSLRRGQTETDERVTDRVLAHLLDRGQRFVQKGLKVLEDLGMIRRVRRFGRRSIVVLERFRGREKPQARGKGDARPPATGAGSTPRCTPEQTAAAHARIAAAARPPEPTPEEIAAGQRLLDEARKRREAAERGKAKLRPVLLQPPRTDAPNVPGRAVQDFLDAKRRALGLPPAPPPAPPPDPPPDPSAGPPPRPDGAT